MVMKRLAAPEGGTSAPVPGGVENLADLAREATDLDVAEADAAQEAREKVERNEQRQAEAEASQQAAMLAAFLGQGRNMAAKLLDRTGKLPEAQLLAIWTDATLNDAAAALVAIPGEQLQWLQELLEKFGPYIALGMAVVPPSWATYEAIKAHAKTKPVDAEAKDAGGQQQPA